jgi:hypothetical protein
MHIDGACHCGQITYEAEVDPADVTICHCTDCQKLVGTAYRVTVSAPRANFRITAGDPKVYVKIAENRRRRMQYFCANCGSPIYTTGGAYRLLRALDTSSPETLQARENELVGVLEIAMIDAGMNLN